MKSQEHINVFQKFQTQITKILHRTFPSSLFHPWLIRTHNILSQLKF